MSTTRFTPNRTLFIRDFGDYRWMAFYCPGCKRRHTLEVGKPSSWTFDGNEDSPTFSPSVLAQGVVDAESDPTPLRCHSFVRAGVIQFLGDCSHVLAGKNVPMVRIPDVTKFPDVDE